MRKYRLSMISGFCHGLKFPVAASCRVRLQALFFSCLLLAVSFALAACQGGRQSSLSPTAGDAGNPPPQTVVATGAQRADPGYVQYLERLSMLGSQVELARVVSGSQLAWLRPSGHPSPDALLAIADSWLHINPLTLLPETKKSVFATLTSPVYWNIFSKARLKGIYFSPVSGSGSLWAYNRKVSTGGEDVIQYTFSESAGKDEEYFNLLNVANTNKKFLGLELTPASTGFGPDFFLAIRYHRQYSGVYCMVELPPKIWPLLPSVSDQWHGVALNDGQVAILAQNKLLPAAMEQDFLPTGKSGGWAVTGETQGIDGTTRRWVYRYYLAPDRPILNWEDPTEAARRILSGSVIRNVGMLGGALVGARLEGLYGLDAALPGETAHFSASPAKEAAIAVSREARRYGGWSWLKDELPLSTVVSLLSDGPDFFRDSIFSPGIEHALLTGSTEILDVLLDDALRLGLDMRRFVHATPAEDGLSYALPHLMDVASGGTSASILSPEQAGDLHRNALRYAQQIVFGAKRDAPKGEDVSPLQGRRLYTTGTGVAALSLGSGNAASVTKEMQPLIRDGHFLQIFVRAMLPGLFMISGQDLAGSLPLSWYSMTDNRETWDVSLTSHGAYGLTQSITDTSVTLQGVPKAKTLYPTTDTQVLDETSFHADLAHVLGVRTTYAIANSRLYGRFTTSVPGCFAYVLLPPSGEGDDPASGAAQGNEAAQTAIAGREVTPGLLKEIDRGASSAEKYQRQQELEKLHRRKMERQIVTAPQREGDAKRGEMAIIAVFNFSREPIHEVIDVALDPVLKAIRSKGEPQLLAKSGTGTGDVDMHFDAKSITITLPPWQGAAVLIGKRK
ncbi:hypothetical protein FACS1894206_00440 [Deltaproteobacteria bacterium]|nr:hypothetical protein FACS1894206_00440 [Deltaproteobacteria bacterium]